MTDTWQATLSQLDDTAKRVIDSLGTERFCLWLKGDLGAGKTTLTGAMMRALGLDARLPVTSPTYTYMNDYVIGEARYAHLDLYRAAAGFSPEEIGLVDVNDYRGYFVEWPEQIPNNPFLQATHVLEIAFEGDDSRRYRLEKKAP